MPCNMNLPKAGVVSTRATAFSSLDPFRKLLLCCVFLLVLIVLVNSSAWAQQNVFSRSEVSTGNWWDNANPWYYQGWNNSQNRPDNNSGTRNYLKIGHNNNLTMTTNGAFFSLSSLDFEILSFDKFITRRLSALKKFIKNFFWFFNAIKKTYYYF